MEDPNDTSHDLSDAVSEATQHAQSRSAVAATAPPPKPRSRGRLLVTAAAILGVVAVWDAYALTRPPARLPPAEEAADLRRFVATVVEGIEDFRSETGRLPSRADLGDLLDPEVSYRLADGSYVVGLEGEGVSVEYDSRTPLDVWMLGSAGDGR